MLQDRQTLVVIHGQHTIRLLQVFLLEQGISRIWSGGGNPQGLRALQHRRDHIYLFPPQVTVFTRMRIQAGHQDARLAQAEFLAQVAVDDLQGFQQTVEGNGRRHILQRQVRGRQGYPQRLRQACRGLAGQHHHHLRSAGFFRQVFGMAAESDAGIVDRAFLQRRGDDRVAPCSSCRYAFYRHIQRVQYGTAVPGIQLARHDMGSQGAIDDGDLPVAAIGQAVVA